MIYDTPKHYFLHILDSYYRILDITSRIERYRELATRITGSLGGVRVQRDPEYSRVEAAVVAIDGLTADIEHVISEYRKDLAEAETVIDTVPSQKAKRLLRLRYLNGVRFDAIREQLGLADIHYVFKLHGYALQATEPALRERSLLK